jgi:hypothetical protein
LKPFKQLVGIINVPVKSKAPTKTHIKQSPRDRFGGNGSTSNISGSPNMTFNSGFID